MYCHCMLFFISTLCFRRVDDLRLTACTPGSAPGPRFGNEYGKPLLLPLWMVTSRFITVQTSFLSPKCASQSIEWNWNQNETMEKPQTDLIHSTIYIHHRTPVERDTDPLAPVLRHHHPAVWCRNSTKKLTVKILLKIYSIKNMMQLVATDFAAAAATRWARPNNVVWRPTCAAPWWTGWNIVSPLIRAHSLHYAKTQYQPQNRSNITGCSGLREGPSDRHR